MSDKIRGVGLNLRLEFIDEFLDRSPSVDFVEVIVDNYHSHGPHHEKLLKVRENYEISFHCVGMNLAGEDDLNISYLNTVKKLMHKFDPFLISDHLCFQKNKNICFHDLLPFPLTKEYLDHVTERVARVQEVIGKSLLIENLSYYVEFNNSEMSEYEFLNELSRRAGSKILLDFNNIWVNEKNLAKSSREYLENINWNLVGECHFAGAEKIDDLYVDTHGTNIDNEVLLLASEYSKELKNTPLVYERDNNIPALDELLGQRNRLIESLQ
ncbi:DUF692 domain-containing protein [Halobacteriovorax sp. HLS]|uniref:DUF692 domain-containing protein n=1 Tax=Halobacteriovorax sp. HLS TaxID=2234000 RepID=UPI000FD90543|nr:DUF692 domain-containing protein [Halobacteriovorax sp. HLS]